MATLVWGHNPGSHSVKNCCAVSTVPGEFTGRRDLPPFDAVIAPAGRLEDFGVGQRQRALSATIKFRDGKRTLPLVYYGGETVRRLSSAIRQPVNGRLGLDSPIYQAFAQMSLSQMNLRIEKPNAYIVTALPAEYRTDENVKALKAHISNALVDHLFLADLEVVSEAAASLYYLFYTDAGEQNRSAANNRLTGLVLSADIGGGMMNHAVLDRLQPLMGQSRSPNLGSIEAINELSARTGWSATDSEDALRAMVGTGSGDDVVRQVLMTYRQRLVSHLEKAWEHYARDARAILVSGGTAPWVFDEIRRAFPKAELVGEHNTQLVAAVGLYRKAMRNYVRNHG